MSDYGNQDIRSGIIGKSLVWSWETLNSERSTDICFAVHPFVAECEIPGSQNAMSKALLGYYIIIIKE